MEFWQDISIYAWKTLQNYIWFFGSFGIEVFAMLISCFPRINIWLEKHLPRESRVKIIIGVLIVGFPIANYQVYYETLKEKRIVEGKFRDYKSKYSFIKSEEEKRVEEICGEIGMLKLDIITFLAKLESNFKQDKFKDFERKINNWLNKTANWIKENIDASSMSDFVYRDKIPELPPNKEYTPEGYLIIKLRNHRKNLIEIEGKQCP